MIFLVVFDSRQSDQLADEIDIIFRFIARISASGYAGEVINPYILPYRYDRLFGQLHHGSFRLGRPLPGDNDEILPGHQFERPDKGGVLCIFRGHNRKGDHAGSNSRKCESPIRSYCSSERLSTSYENNLTTRFGEVGRTQHHTRVGGRSDFKYRKCLAYDGRRGFRGLILPVQSQRQT